MAVVPLLAALCAYAVPSQLLRQFAVWALVACGVFHAAHAGRPQGWGRGQVDLSYGVYIYAFPVQQAVTQWSLRHGWPLAACMALSLVLVLALAWVSWFRVERPCIEWAQRRLGRG